MGVVIDSEVWKLNPSVFIFIIVASFLSIFVLPHFSNRTTSSISDVNAVSSSFSFISFQRKFLFFYSLSSVLEGLSLVYGEFEMVDIGLTKQQMIVLLSAGCLASLIFGTFLGMISDAIGHKKFCLLFSILHLIMGVWKTLAAHPTVWIANICLSLASSIFSFSFETWMVLEHDKQGYRQDALNDTFWLMIFSESASLIASQVLGNWALGYGSKSLISPSVITMLLATINLALTARGWSESPARRRLKEHRAEFFAYIFGDKRIWLLGCAQACLHFSVAVFWILWAPTIVADGREVQLGLIIPCLLGARMLGSTVLPWTLSGLLSLRIEDYLLYEFISAGILLSIVAYDYQEIGVLVALFCLFQAVAGLILPSLSRLRTMYVPNEFRAGMISLSLAPANAAILCVLIQGGYYKNIYNSSIAAFAALGLFLAAGCMHLLKNLGKQPHQSWHKQ
ncbi:uncharacterized protein LOC104894920 isoform X1 [Beta vulgaris subsp. vulgaris]|uniref:uncharacterized protein LOC104894920 isoform X1 n=1 Tax=Beta vulgaris subsp. vulgaris TaxID=3555 RepID=UPI002036BF56|nr:uncharacterized protein LOC104894920 isoform X1 [Beta vulgaris subsp. vulgaris]